MDTKKQLNDIKNYHGYSLKRMSGALGISSRRIEELIAGYTPTKEESHKVATLKRFCVMCGRGLNFDGEISFELGELKRLDKDLHDRLSKVDPDTEESVIECVNCIKAESMYLGTFYSNNNQEEVVLNEVKKNRNVKGYR